MTMGALLQSGLNLCQATFVKVPTDFLITEPRGLLHKMPMASVEHGVEFSCADANGPLHVCSIHPMFVPISSTYR